MSNRLRIDIPLKPDKPKKLNKPEKPDKPEKVFRKDYADAYDLLYTDKDYEAECDMIEEIFSRYGDDSIKSILDLGCGTGNHAIPLAQRGYQVTGVDISPDMLRIAKKKASDLQLSTFNSQPTFLQGDIRSLNLGKTFDAVLMMFAVLGYQTTNDDVLATLRIVRRHLKPDGLFIFDVWYSPAVLTIRPSQRVRNMETSIGRIIRSASADLDVFNHVANIHYNVVKIAGNLSLEETNEDHKMRYFFPQELAFFLTQADLQMITIRTFGNIDLVPSESTWNVIIIAERSMPP
jgi:SAM-dependent methyltransferase